ncbi:selenocysteine lyase [Anabrus simplex]|uniref:selenocysteine lyase n=1 Tax=Anabrus simplex TaxID=316456 RepID=UPI0034DCFDB0
MPVYMDHNATTPVAPSVIHKITEALKNEWGNPSSKYDLGVKAQDCINEAREHIACMIGGKPRDIVFTSGGTETNNMVIFGAVEYFNVWRKKASVEAEKPHVITTNVEHDAVLFPLRYLEDSGRIDVSYVPVSDDGCISAEKIVSHVQPYTCLVSVMMANNETGIVMPIEEIGLALKKVNTSRKSSLPKILFHSDAAQVFGKIEVDVLSLNVDYMTVVGHKFYGPRIGCLYARDINGETPVFPMMFGGSQERGFRPGTENTAMIVGLGEAARLVNVNIKKDRLHLETMRDYLEKKLEEAFENLVVFNCRRPNVTRLPNTSNISLRGEAMAGHRVLAQCEHVLASVGAACHEHNQPSKVLIASGVSPALAANAIRLSVGRYTTEKDVDIVVADLSKAVEYLILYAS